MKTTMKKPTPLRVLFILNLLLVIICYTFYGFAQSEGNVAGVPAIKILYTAIAYSVLFIGIIASIKKFSLTGLRIVIALIFIASIPATAFIGMLFSVISFVLTFNSRVKTYLNQ